MNMRIFFENSFEKGEDAGISGEHYAIVFDGLGGTGGASCRDAQGNVRTEAKVASNASAQIVEKVIQEHWDEWYQQLRPDSVDEIESLATQIAKQLKENIDNQLMLENRRWGQDGEILKLPSTIAGWITFPMPGNRLLAIAVWAGDSRCYVINDQHMHQISVDDSDVDANESIMMEILDDYSPSMSNRIGMNPYQLHTHCVLLSDTALLVACTDGMYGSVDSPMHLEYYLRLGGGESSSMANMRDKFSAFIQNSLLIKDDSCTVCALAFAPKTGEFNEISDMLYAPVEKLGQDFIDAFPKKPELPDSSSEVNAALRKLFRSLAGTPSFVDGLVAYVEEQANKPVLSGESGAAADMISALHARLEQKQREARVAMSARACDQEEAERKLNESIANLRHIQIVDEQFGNEEMMLDWSGLPTDADKAEGFLNWFHGNLFLDNGNRNGLYKSTYRRIDSSSLQRLEAGIHDMTVWVNKQAYQRMTQVFTTYKQKKVDVIPVARDTQKCIFDMLVNDSGELRDALPDLRMSLDELQTLLKYAAKVREYRNAPAIQPPESLRVKLTQEEIEQVKTEFALSYARQIVMRWYEKRERPNAIELSEKVARACENELKKCWAIDEQCKNYNANYQKFKDEVMELWYKYLTDYRKWDAALELPEDLKNPVVAEEEPETPAATETEQSDAPEKPAEAEAEQNDAPAREEPGEE